MAEFVCDWDHLKASSYKRCLPKEGAIEVK